MTTDSTFSPPPDPGQPDFAEGMWGRGRDHWRHGWDHWHHHHAGGCVGRGCGCVVAALVMLFVAGASAWALWLR